MNNKWIGSTNEYRGYQAKGGWYRDNKVSIDLGRERKGPKAKT